MTVSTAQQDLFIADLPDRVVGGFTAAAGKGVGWVPLEFTIPGLSGVGLATGAASGADELVLDLNLEGEWVLYFALTGHSALRVWLDGEKPCRELRCEHGGFRFQEARLHRADLTGRRLHIAPSVGHRAKGLGLGYIRAVREDHAPRASARNLVGTNDGWSYFALDGFDSPADIQRMFTALRDSDFARLLYGPCGADYTTWHPTRVGTVARHDPLHAFRLYDRNAGEAARRLARTRTDPLAIARDMCRDLGIEFHVYVRPEAFGSTFPNDGQFDSDFMLQNPQWQCVDEEGDPIARMSYAYPQVQDHMLAWFEELLAYEPQGLSIAFNRSLPMMICEDPVLQEFKRRHGRLPNLPEEVDSPQMLRVRQDLLAGFLERVHQLVTSRNAVLTCIVDCDPDQNALRGFDLAGAVARGWFESVYCTTNCNSPSWQSLKHDSRARIYPSGKLWEHGHDQPTLARKALEVLDQGAAGLFFWDIETEFENPYNWHVVRHLGNRDFLQKTIDGQIPPPRLINYTHIGGKKVGRYNPANSY